MKVLVADDDPVSLRVLRSTLEKFGYEVSVSHDGASAWRRYQAEPFSLVITDWEMPGLDGIEFCHRIRQANVPSYTYIIFLTTRRERHHMIECLSAGGDDFLTKPFNADELRVRLRAAERILDLEHHLRDANRELRRMNKRLLKMSRIDPLMEIGNRLAFEEKFADYHRGALAAGVAYGVVMVDVDHFKSCNDSFGHQNGDDVLRQVAAAIRTRLRANDAAFRYGGEEILILLSHQNLRGAAAAAERLRQSVEQLEFQIGETGEKFQVTVSCGVACHPLDYDSENGWHSLVECADRALYQAKAAGRNCVYAAEVASDGIRFLPAKALLQQLTPELSEPRPGESAPVK